MTLLTKPLTTALDQKPLALPDPLPEWDTFRALNEPHEQPLWEWLTGLVCKPEQHGRFLNTLSLLEHIGSRKLLLSHTHQTLSKAVLKHLSEETRHAYFFKRQAERMAQCPLPDYSQESCVCPASATMYFGRLDAHVTQTVGAEHAYAWVSFLVELRACWLYRLYDQVLEKEPSVTLSLKPILADEDGHLVAMKQACQMLPLFQRTFQTLMEEELGLFKRLFDQLESYHTKT